MPDPSTDPIRIWRKLAQNNLMANQRLNQACARLTPVEFTAPRKSFFPTIRATLNHILIVDQFYVDALEGGTLGVSIFEDEEPRLTMASLIAAQIAVDQRLLRLIIGLTAAALNAPVRIHRRDRVQVERCDDTLSHLFQHQTHHRGQVHAMLSGSSIAPPQLDEFIMADDAPSRLQDLVDRSRPDELIRLTSCHSFGP